MMVTLRRRFILWAMAAFFSVIFILVIALNAWNYFSFTRQQDHTLMALSHYNGKGPLPLDKGPLHIFPFKNSSKELKYMVRFFSVTVKQDGTFTTINRNFIASISDQDAEEYAKAVLKMKRDKGYYDGYRFLVQQEGAEKSILFLNSERELNMVKTSATMSLIIALFSLSLLFVLVVFFSKRAIAPFVRNMELQKRFITDAGHELKTPLASIMASADILAMDYGNNEWIENIQSQSQTLSHLIGNLITLSRLDEERPFFKEETFSLSDLLWEIAEPMAAMASCCGKTLSIQVENDLTYTADSESIGKMVSVLLDNAVKYSCEGDEILFVAKRERKKILIETKNRFSGTLPPDPNVLFERFYRADDSRTEKNSFGIGLSVAKSIAEKHGGSVEAKVKDHFITFSVRLP